MPFQLELSGRPVGRRSPWFITLAFDSSELLPPSEGLGGMGEPSRILPPPARPSDTHAEVTSPMHRAPRRLTALLAGISEARTKIPLVAAGGTFGFHPLPQMKRACPQPSSPAEYEKRGLWITCSKRKMPLQRVQGRDAFRQERHWI